jgi:pyridoxal 5'-phosphate synthase pdxT subunit
MALHGGEMQHILKSHEIAKADFTRARDCSMFDAARRRYVDLESGTWCTALGHGHPRINRAIRRQLRLIAHTGYRYPTSVVEEAAREVLDVLGMADGRCVFLCSGSEAVEFGVQAARRITGRPLFLTFKGSFLGSFGSAGAKAAAEWHLLDWESCADPVECLRGVPFHKVSAFVFEPGGSGTGRLATLYGLMEPLRAFGAAHGVWGTCAGAILLSRDARRGQPLLGLMDITVERNAFGRQSASFETDIDAPCLGGGASAAPYRAVFIRAPVIRSVGPGVEVLAALPDGRVVAAREGALLSTAFHPELTTDARFHAYFASLVKCVP